jgi:hypothetical protein
MQLPTAGRFPVGLHDLLKPNNWIRTARHKNGKNPVLAKRSNVKLSGREPVRKCQK